MPSATARNVDRAAQPRAPQSKLRAQFGCAIRVRAMSGPVNATPVTRIRENSSPDSPPRESSAPCPESPQGATVSPLLANLYLHYVLDLWAHQWRRRHARGDLVIVRYADDFAVGFEHEEDGRRFLEDLRGRLREFKLELLENKTRLIEFGRYANANRRRRGECGAAETFCFLGFVHIRGRSRRGRFLLTRHTDPKRMRARLKAIVDLKRRRHDPVPEQRRWLGRVVRGYLAYFAVPTNSVVVARFRSEVIRHWRRHLCQRSRRHRFNWGRMSRLANRCCLRLGSSIPGPTRAFTPRPNLSVAVVPRLATIATGSSCPCLRSDGPHPRSSPGGLSRGEIREVRDPARVTRVSAAGRWLHHRQW